MTNSANILFAATEPWPSWLYFLIMAGALLLGAAGALFWFMTARKKHKRKHKRKRHGREQRQPNPTLAQTSGLPPKRDPNQPSASS